MSSSKVADELADLRSRSVTKHHAATLSAKTVAAGTGLSTPEAEEAALKAAKERERVGNYSREAEATLHAGVKDVGISQEFYGAEAGRRKWEERERKVEAERNLRGFNEARAQVGQASSPKVPLAGSPDARAKTWVAAPTPAVAPGVAVPVAPPAAAAAPAPAPTAPSPAASAAAPPASPTAPPAAASFSARAAPSGDDALPPATTAELADPPPASPAEPVPVVAADVDIDYDGDDDVPDLEEDVVGPSPSFDATAAAATAPSDFAPPVADAATTAVRPPPNRAEKKFRKAMSRLDMRPLSGIARVTLKSSRQGGYFAIDDPDVFVGGRGNNRTYVVFGEARQGGTAGGGERERMMRQAAAAQAQAQQAAAAQATATAPAPQAVEAVPSVDAAGGYEEGEEVVDETGVEPKDIELVMSQAACSRGKAVQALRENDGDLVNAIMSLTT